jgi:hypothetical protein
LNKFDDKNGPWRPVQAVLIAGIVVCAVVLIPELLLPVKLNSNASGVLPVVSPIDANSLSQTALVEADNNQSIAKITRSGLFKLASSVQDKPMAGKTIDMIRSQLKLRCIIELDGEPVAYVHIKNEGLQKCKVGDSVKDLFTVLNINDNSIEITILGHRQILSL